MVSTVIGIAIARRGAALVVAEVAGGKACVVFSRAEPRPAGAGVAQALTALLTHLPKHRRTSRLRIALSPGDLACTDVLEAPPGTGGSALCRLAPALCEARCAGEVLEDLSVDAVRSGNRIRAAAMRSDLLAEIRLAAASQGYSIELVTSLPMALAASANGETALDLAWGGERMELRRVDGEVTYRAHPVDGDRGDAGGDSIRLGSSQAPREQALALASAVADADAVPNVLRGAPDAPRSVLARLRAPLLCLGVAGAILLSALGWRFHREKAALEGEGEETARIEGELWKKYLPGAKPMPGSLVRAMRERLAELGEAMSEADFPSALSFWSEIARRLPEPDSIGLTLETLDLSPDGGRLAARVEAAPGDPLKNAALLENGLNGSERLTARGDYETREQEVLVRLRMDYRGANGRNDGRQ